MKLFISRGHEHHHGPSTQYMLVNEGVIQSISHEKPNPLPDHVEIIRFDNDYIYPSFNDTHMHLIGYGTYLNRCQLEHTQSIKDIQTRLMHDMAEHPSDILYGRGWNQDDFQEKRLPNRFDLDAVSLDVPMILYRACGHMAVVNSAAIKHFNLTPQTVVEGGALDSHEGELTGILRENALSLVSTNNTFEDLRNDILRAQQKLNAYGITSVQTDDLIMVPLEQHRDLIQLFEDMAENNTLTVRVYLQAQFFTSENLEKQVRLGYRQNKGNDLFKHGPVKILADGSLGARTAKLREPYHDDPHAQGILIHSEEELDDIINAAFKHDLDVVIHGIGDYTIQIAIEKINHYQEIYQRKNPRNAIVHCQIMDAPLIKRMAESHIDALVQPVFLEYDMTIVEKRVGSAMAATSYAYKTMAEQGIVLGFGSDAPVEDPNPFRSLYYAIHRKRPGIHGQSYFPEEALSFKDSYDAFTSKAAYFSYEEDHKGKLEPGYLADFIVVSEPLETLEPEALLHAKIKATYLGGTCVFQTSQNS